MYIVFFYLNSMTFSQCHKQNNEPKLFTCFIHITNIIGKVLPIYKMHFCPQMLVLTAVIMCSHDHGFRILLIYYIMQGTSVLRR